MYFSCWQSHYFCLSKKITKEKKKWRERKNKKDFFRFYFKFGSKQVGDAKFRT
jgi:hypothetical protein